MEQKINYSRFYGLLKTLNISTEEKEQLVYQFTKKRTTSLKEMTLQEYKQMCSSLNEMLKKQMQSPYDMLRKKRSQTLRLLQKLGVDTTNWDRINGFCLDKRIAGMEFRSLTYEDHDALQRKLRAIEKNGGLKPIEKKQENKTIIVYTFSNDTIN